MSIKFTKHALLHIKARNISKEEVADALDNPESIIKSESYFIA
ncbi:MAG: DUF4258 domain-containing protein [Candidatus Lokiarchaeota archaeon]|nr:DUF4258 domain-containing protein [Candidatus Lokiarchaeota archaeon]MBD3339166.1 DUF4258 domain-containing protein [Candidatus Lokiarchaeota archaeon]